MATLEAVQTQQRKMNNISMGTEKLPVEINIVKCCSQLGVMNGTCFVNGGVKTNNESERD